MQFLISIPIPPLAKSILVLVCLRLWYTKIVRTSRARFSLVPDQYTPSYCCYCLSSNVGSHKL